MDDGTSYGCGICQVHDRVWIFCHNINSKHSTKIGRGAPSLEGHQTQKEEALRTRENCGRQVGGGSTNLVLRPLLLLRGRASYQGKLGALPLQFRDTPSHTVAQARQNVTQRRVGAGFAFASTTTSLLVCSDVCVKPPTRFEVANTFVMIWTTCSMCMKLSKMLVLETYSLWTYQRPRRSARLKQLILFLPRRPSYQTAVLHDDLASD